MRCSLDAGPRRRGPRAPGRVSTALGLLVLKGPPKRQRWSIWFPFKILKEVLPQEKNAAILGGTQNEGTPLMSLSDTTQMPAAGCVVFERKLAGLHQGSYPAL